MLLVEKTEKDAFARGFDQGMNRKNAEEFQNGFKSGQDFRAKEWQVEMSKISAKFSRLNVSVRKALRIAEQQGQEKQVSVEVTKSTTVKGCPWKKRKSYADYKRGQKERDEAGTS